MPSSSSGDIPQHLLRALEAERLRVASLAPGPQPNYRVDRVLAADAAHQAALAGRLKHALDFEWQRLSSLIQP